MKKIKDILEKLKNFIKRLIKRENILLISETSEIPEETKVEEITVNDIEIEKKEFFELYKNVKNGNTSIDNLMINDLIKVLLMMKNEVMAYDDKIKCKESNIINLDAKIKILEKENESIKINLKN